MTQTTPNTYFRTKVMTASPAELRLMLLDGAIKFAGQGRQGLIDKNYEASFNGVSRCQSIVLELINILEPEHDPDLCQRLSALYTYMYTRLIKASSDRDPEIVAEVIRLLEYERETWVLLLQKLAEENSSAGQLQSVPDAQAPLPPADDKSGLIGGSVSVTG